MPSAKDSQVSFIDVALGASWVVYTLAILLMGVKIGDSAAEYSRHRKPKKP